MPKKEKAPEKKSPAKQPAKRKATTPRKTAATPKTAANDKDFGLPAVEVQPVNRPTPPAAQPTYQLSWLLFLLMGIAMGSGIGYLHFRLTAPHENSVMSTSLQQVSQPAVATETPAEATGEEEGEQQEEAATTTTSETIAVASEEEEDEVEQVLEPTGDYYTIANSFRNLEYALIYAFELQEEVDKVYVLAPEKEGGVYRVALAKSTTKAEAHANLKELQEKYGKDLWPFHY